MLSRVSLNLNQQKQSVSFCARPEYQYLDEHHGVRTSCYFRRGANFGEQMSSFSDVVDAFKLVFSCVKKPKILIAGIGKGQELFSDLAVIKELKRKSLRSVIDLNCVDLQPKLAKDEFESATYLDDIVEPKFAKECFEYVQKPTYSDSYHYKVKRDIVRYLKKVFNNKSKTKWDTKIEEFSATCPEKTYNMISVNNTLMYIEDVNEKKSTMENLAKMLKTGGILVTDVCDDIYKEMFSCLKDFKNLKPGIWQKLV